jgi:hypothetical protein
MIFHGIKRGEKMKKTLDRVSWKACWEIFKFRDPTGEIAKAISSGVISAGDAVKEFAKNFIAFEEIDHNLALNEGLQLLIGLIAGTSGDTGNAWDNGHAYLGVGDSNTAPAASQTGLQASTNKTYKAMDTSYPTRSNQTCTWQATFGSSDANYSWQEYTVVNASTDTGKNLNRCIADKGTKASGETWVLQLSITFS